jgi:hypothetical protein
MRWTALLTLMVIIGVWLAACSDDEQTLTPTASALPDAANATYLIEGKQVKLDAGKSEVPAAPGSASLIVTSLTSTSASGDLDGDRRPDVAVVLTQSPSGSGTFFYLAALTASGTTPAPTALLGDRINVNGVEVRGGVISVSYLTRPSDAPFTATPSMPASKTFSLSGGQLRPN